jgi:hypothetical protein
MTKSKELAALLIIGSVSLTTTSSAQTAQQVDRAIGAIFGAAGSGSKMQRASQGACQVDLSVESIELRKTTPTGVTSVRAVFQNVGSEQFSSTPVFGKFRIEVIDGRTSRVLNAIESNIVVVAPGQTRQSGLTLRREIFNGFRRSGGEIRATLSFSPNAPRCGLDTNSENDQLIATNQQVLDWLNGGERIVFVRR